MMDWIQAFLRKHRRLQAFDDFWKALPPYPGFLVPKKAYREVAQSQGKEMSNLGCCILGVLAVALRQPQSSEVIPFKQALGCVRGLVDFSMMAQSRSHTSDTIAYMEHYLDQFHRMKGIFLEFGVTKRTLAKVDEQRREIRHERTQMSQPVAPSKRRRIRDDDREVILVIIYTSLAIYRCIPQSLDSSRTRNKSRTDSDDRIKMMLHAKSCTATVVITPSK